MPVRPVSFSVLVTELADRVAGMRPGQWLRVAVDGAAPTRPEVLANALVEPVKLRGRAVIRVSGRNFLRPASLRFEHGRTDPDAFYADWLDLGALRREVLTPLADDGTGQVLPSLWDARTDRATRADYVPMPVGGVLVLDGELLLGRGLPVDLAVHLWLSPAALARKLPDDQRWTLPGYARYEREARPGDTADVVVRVDNPEHPAILRES